MTGNITNSLLQLFKMNDTTNINDAKAEKNWESTDLEGGKAETEQNSGDENGKSGISLKTRFARLDVDYAHVSPRVFMVYYAMDDTV